MKLETKQDLLNIMKDANEFHIAHKLYSNMTRHELEQMQDYCTLLITQLSNLLENINETIKNK